MLFLIWLFTENAYKHCFNNLVMPANQRYKVVPPHRVDLLNQVWKDKLMAPRVQNFAWRLLRRALPTCKRASKFYIHINKECCRCGMVEDETHMLFLCPMAKAPWFYAPWFIRTKVMAGNRQSIPHMNQALVSSSHPQINISNLFTFL